nr:hypothetical protein [Tanacetum cinerariifolium]GEX67868.1 hypothetical protein [Tanacetum cinerariifolium]
MEDLNQLYLDELKRLSNLEYRDEIKIAELKENFNGMSIEIRKKEKLQQLEHHTSLSIEEPDNSLSMGDEHLDTISATESDEFIKSSVENLIPIPNQFEDFSESNDEFSWTDDDSFYIDKIHYVEASPPDSELVSSEVMKIVISEVGGIDDDILLTIKDDILRENMLNVNHLFDKIEALNDNPIPLYDPIMSRTPLTLTPSGEKYEVFHDDHVKEISSGSPTIHSDSSLYDSFIFDFSINPFPPADRSDFYEFADELIPFIPPPEYDCFLFTIEPNSEDFTKDVMKDISLTKEPKVHNALPTHPPFN